jgi:hypothetical protein
MGGQKMAVIDLHEGNGCSQDLLASVTYKKGRRINFKKSKTIENDEARSCSLHDLPVGAVVRFFDNPKGKKDDDWCEITVKKSHQQYCVGSFERTYEDDFVRVTYHKDNGLDGKVSRMEMD